MTASSEQVIDKPHSTEPGFLHHPESESTTTAVAKKNNSDPLLITNKSVVHHPKAGLNPLADAAAYLFTIIGRLKQIKSYRHLNKLQKELILEINHFQDAAKAQGYSSEYILVSRFALCVTLDDIISNTLWGGQGQWDNYAMLAVFNQDAMNHERFFVILERIIKDPAQYIDVMEFMYLCLSLGFKGNYRTTEYGSNQLEQITDVLYKRIRSYHGDVSNSLAPYTIKATQYTKPTNNKIPLWVVVSATLAIILVIFMGLGYLLDTISNEAYQDLTHIGNSLLYETTHT